MIWQFQELGYDVSIDFNGRTGNKPIQWEYAQEQQRKALFQAYAKFISLKKNNPVFNAINPIYNLAGAVKFIKLSIANQNMVVIGNFDVVNQMATVDLGSAGTWYEFGNNNTLNFSSTIYSKILLPGEYHIFSKTALIN